jgi:hypothetical protein
MRLGRARLNQLKSEKPKKGRDFTWPCDTLPASCAHLYDPVPYQYRQHAEYGAPPFKPRRALPGVGVCAISDL